MNINIATNILILYFVTLAFSIILIVIGLIYVNKQSPEWVDGMLPFGAMLFFILIILGIIYVEYSTL